MIYIGIDCGVHTGVAIWNSVERRFESIYTTVLYRALLDVLELRQKGTELFVVFEDARRRKWLPQEKSISEQRGRMMGAGSVRRDSAIWEEFCTGEGIPFAAQAPSKGMTKWSTEAFAAITGYKGKTSNHARDAALLVFGR
jgi:hypothetical protein